MMQHVPAAVAAVVIALSGPAAGQVRQVPPVRQIQKPVLRAQPAACLPTRMAVAGRGAEQPPRSFTSLDRALKYAESQKLCAVEIEVGAGSQAGEFLITQPTTLKGRPGAALKGSVRNPGGFELVIEDLTVSSAPDTAILQGGGRVTLRNVTVSLTRRTSDAVRSGTAVELHSGAEGRFSNLTLEGNEGVALYLDGENTVAWATDLVVRKNRVNTAARDQHIKTSVFNRVGAVEVAGQAELYVDRYEIADNEMYGLLVRHRGAAHLRNGTVSETRGYKPKNSDITYGGNNVMSSTEARIELTAFKTLGAEACGLRLARALLKTSEGEVHDNAIGFCAIDPAPGFDLTCVLGKTVRFYKNSTNLDVGSLPVPNPACATPNPPPGCSPVAACPGVPWRTK